MVVCQHLRCGHMGFCILNKSMVQMIYIYIYTLQLTDKMNEEMSWNNVKEKEKHISLKIIITQTKGYINSCCSSWNPHKETSI